MKKDPIKVVCGLILSAGRILVAQKKTGLRKGLWEFPGGKINSGESSAQALERELFEELCLSGVSSDFFSRVIHEYEDVCIDLECRIVRNFSGIAKAMEHEKIDWCTPEELFVCGLCAADRELVEANRTGFMDLFLMDAGTK